MFKIGEFSRLGCVTIETLRHYDAVGLLNPEKVHPTTGYRYYTARQLKTLHQIIALKDVGLSLEEIAHILRDNPPLDKLRQLLSDQLDLTENTIKAAQHRRALILTRLNHLFLEENMPAYEVTLKSIEPHIIASIREVVPTINQMPRRSGERFNQIATWMMTNKLPFGAPLTIYHNESHVQENIDAEYAFIIPVEELSRIPQPENPIVLRQIEAIPQVAATIVTGDVFQKVNGLTNAYQAIGQWVEEHGLHICGAPRELYYGSPQTGDFTVEIQFPVGK